MKAASLVLPNGSLRDNLRTTTIARVAQATQKQQLFELKILYGVEFLDPEVSQVGNSTVSHLIDTLIPVDICRRHYLVPLSKNEDQNSPSVLVAMVDPDNLEASDDLNRILRPQGLALQRMVITQEDYQQIINHYLDQLAIRQKHIEQQNLQILIKI